LINADILEFNGQEYIKVWFRPSPPATEKMKTIKSAKRNNVTGNWNIPIEDKEEFIKKMSNFLIVWHTPSEIRGGGIDESRISNKPRGDYDVEYNEDGTIKWSKGWKVPPLAEYQVKGFNKVRRSDFLILADEQGLGKTWIMSTALEAKKNDGLIERGLILCKASLLYNWKEEIERFTDLKPMVVTGGSQARRNFYKYLVRETVECHALIMSYETFRNDVSMLQATHHYYPFDYMVLDEAQKIANPTSQIGTSIHYLDIPYKYLLTGTPLPNTPLQAYNYFKLGGIIEENWWQFQKKYAIFGGYNNKEIIGYQNMNQLQLEFKFNMLRRLKKDKLKELPDVLFSNIRIDMTKEQKKLYDGVVEGIMADLVESSLDNVPTALAKIMRLQQITDSPALLDAPGESGKLNALDDLLESIIEENNSKVIVFSKFRTMIDIFLERYKSYNPVCIHGGVSPEDRHKVVKKFQEDPTVKLFLGSTPACREGITLTAASDVVFYDLEWNWANYAQAYSRAHRIGQKNFVMVYNLICRDSIDEYVNDVVRKKKSISETLLDVKTEKNPVQNLIQNILKK
jgi:SNF2 family DNA or RNA helicase